MQADPTRSAAAGSTRQSRKPEPGSESVLDPEQDARVAWPSSRLLRPGAACVEGPRRYWAASCTSWSTRCGSGRRAGRPGVAPGSRGAGPLGAHAASRARPLGWAAPEFSTWEGVVSGPADGRTAGVGRPEALRRTREVGEARRGVGGSGDGRERAFQGRRR